MTLKLSFSGGGWLSAKHRKTVFTSPKPRRFDAAIVGMASIPDVMVSTLKDASSGIEELLASMGKSELEAEGACSR
jgi:hypothetical protein